MMGEWCPPEDTEPKIEGPPRNNPIVGYIVQRLFNIVHPPTVSSQFYIFILFSHFICRYLQFM